MSPAQTAAIFVASLGAAAGVGIAASWWLHRRTKLSAVNVYLVWIVALPLAVAAIGSGDLAAGAAGAVVLVGASAAAMAARRWRLGALGAGGQLRQYERSRVMAWNTHRARDHDERVRIIGQGELVRERGWPPGVPALPMTSDGRGRIPMAAGMHLFFVGATGSGKTTSARRWLLARGLTPKPTTGLLVLDPKGDDALQRDLRGIATEAGRPFVLFDPFDPATDRWNPIWAEDPGAVVARLVAPVEADSDSDASHYSRVLRVHLGIVAEALQTAGRWPVSLPVLLRCAQRSRFDQIATLAHRHAAEDFRERLDDHRIGLESRATQNQLDGSLRALEVVAGQAWRHVLTPHPQAGAVALPAAMAAGAIVLFKTHVEDAKEEAETITTLALADIAAAALTLPHGVEWVLLIDEFGSVLQGRAGERAIALMQRARSSHGQVALSTQSVADIAASTGNEQLLAALADNFNAFVLHRQTSPESRDWLAKLLGTREVWQSTDRTTGAHTSAAGSRRRAAEFIVRPDDFKLLRTGEAVVWTTLGPPPEQVAVTPGPTLAEGSADAGRVYKPVRISAMAEVLDAEHGTPVRRDRPIEPHPAPRRDTGTPAGDLFRDV